MLQTSPGRGQRLCPLISLTASICRFSLKGEEVFVFCFERLAHETVIGAALNTLKKKQKQM